MDDWVGIKQEEHQVGRNTGEGKLQVQSDSAALCKSINDLEIHALNELLEDMEVDGLMGLAHLSHCSDLRQRTCVYPSLTWLMINQLPKKE